MSKPGRRTVLRMGRRANNVPRDRVTYAAPGGSGAILEPKLKVWSNYSAGDIRDKRSS